MMQALPSADRLSDILLALYGAEDLDDFRRRALATVEREFGGELVCHNEVNLHNGDSLSALSQPIAEFDALRPRFFDHIEQHPSVQHHLALRGAETRAVKTSDFVSQRRWRNSDIYQAFYRPLADVRYQLTIGQAIDSTLILFAISRRHRDFSESERGLLSLLRPHFMQSYRHARERGELKVLSARAVPAQCEDGALEFGLMTRYELSRREAQVLLQLAAGKSNVEIADALGISVSTVKTRLEQVFRQLGVNSRAAAIPHVLRMTPETIAATRASRAVRSAPVT
jgi:DNA-binding CsgD family transcriptional regulator